eukprot:749884-Hanusia_phi.AAC.4
MFISISVINSFAPSSPSSPSSSKVFTLLPKVYAIEANKEAFEAARKTVEDQGLSNVILVPIPTPTEGDGSCSQKISLVFGHSTQVEIPEKVGQLGNILFTCRAERYAGRHPSA